MLLTALLLSSYYLFGYTLKKVNNSDVNVVEDVEDVNEANNLKFGGANNKPYHISYKTELPLYLTGTYYFVKYAQETHAIEFKTPSIRNHELLKDNPLLCSQLINKRGKDITKANWIKRKKIIRNELILWISKIITPNILDDILPFMWNKYFPVYASCFFNSGPYWSTSKSHNENLLRSSGIHLDTNNPINPVLFLGVSDDGYPFGIPIRNDLNLEKQIKRMIKDSIPNILILFENKPISKKGIEGYFNKVQIDLIPIDTDFYTNTEKDSIETRLVYNLNFYIKLVQIFQELETAVEHATFKINKLFLLYYFIIFYYYLLLLYIIFLFKI